MNNFNMNIYSKGVQNVDITDDEFRKLINSDNIEEHMSIKGFKSIASIMLTVVLGISFVLSSNFIFQSIFIIGFANMILFYYVKFLYNYIFCTFIKIYISKYFYYRICLYIDIWM